MKWILPALLITLPCCREELRPAPAPSVAAPATKGIAATILHVHDGDSFTAEIDGIRGRVRIEGIDAPEKGQAFGDKSKSALELLVTGRAIRIAETGNDRYGRTLARVYADGVDVGRTLVKAGWAWHFARYNKDADLAIAQVEAQERRAGIWSDPDPPLPPWEWRKVADVTE